MHNNNWTDVQEDDDTMEYVEGLSDFDLQRPRRVCVPEYFIDSSGEMVPATISIDINDGETFGGDEIKCSICLGILEKTWTVTACLHRFCSDCLHRSLRVQLGSQKIHHECPLCRAKLASRRSSKPDPKFDTLIGILLGVGVKTDIMDVEDTEKTDPDVLSVPVLGVVHPSNGADGDDRIDASLFRSLHEENIRKFRERQKEYKNDLRNNISSEQRRSVSMKMSAEHSSSANLKNVPELVLWSLQPLNIQNLKILQNNLSIQSLKSSPENMNSNAITNEDNLQPNVHYPSLQNTDSKNTAFKNTDFKEKRLKKAYLKSSGCMSVKDVKGYLLKKINESNDNNDEDFINHRDFSFDLLKMMVIEIYTATDDQILLLDDSVTLKDVCTKYWNKNSELYLYFKLKFS